MAKRPTNRVKATVWTETVRAEIDGTIQGVCLRLFDAVPPAVRGDLLDLLQRRHRELCEREDE